MTNVSAMKMNECANARRILQDCGFSPPFYQFFGRFKGHFCYLLRIDKLICFFRSLGEEPFLHNLSLFVQNQNFPIRVKNHFKASLKKFWLTPAWLPPIWPTEMNRVSLASNWTRALIWSPLLWTLFRRLSPPDAPLTINLEKKSQPLLNNLLQQFPLLHKIPNKSLGN